LGFDVSVGLVSSVVSTVVILGVVLSILFPPSGVCWQAVSDAVKRVDASSRVAISFFSFIGNFSPFLWRFYLKKCKKSGCKFIISNLFFLCNICASTFFIWR